MTASERTLGAIALALLLTLPFAVQVGFAAENVHDGSAMPDSANETETVEHTFGYQVENVSNDGNSDELFVTFSDEVADDNLSSFSGNVTDADTGESISISSSPSIVDGPDGDGVKETVKIGVQSEGERETVDLIVNVTGSVTWPAVDADNDFPVKASVTDSARGNVTLLTFASVTVRDESSTTGTATPTETTSGTTTATTTPTAPTTSTATPTTDGTTGETATPSPTAMTTPNATETDTPAGTNGDGPGFGAVGMLVAILLSTALLVPRRR